MIFNIITLIGLVLLIFIKPYNDTKLYRLEVFNESMILLLSDLAFLFSDIESNPFTKNQAAWAFISFLILSILVNLLTQLKELYWIFKYKFFFRYCKKQVLKYNQLEVSQTVVFAKEEGSSV